MTTTMIFPCDFGINNLFENSQLAKSTGLHNTKLSRIGTNSATDRMDESTIRRVWMRASDPNMSDTNRTAGIIIGSSIGIGIILGLGLFTLLCLCNRRRKRNGYSSANETDTGKDNSHNDSKPTTLGPSGWSRDLPSRDDEAGSAATWSAASSRFSTPRQQHFIPVAPDMPVAEKAATILGLAEDAHHKPYSPYNRVSIPYNQDPETASTREIHTLSPRHGPTMDDAFNDLALELARGTGQRSNAGRPSATRTIPSSTPTVFPKDTSIRQAWRESSMPAPKSVIRKPVQSGSPSPAPPRNGEYRRLTGQAKYHPHHSRQPEGAFF
jgi:hypothetical protein